MFDVIYLFLVIKRMLHSYLNLRGKHANIISAFCIQKKKKLRKIQVLLCLGKHADGREKARVWVAIFTRARVLSGLGSSS